MLDAPLTPSAVTRPALYLLLIDDSSADVALLADVLSVQDMAVRVESAADGAAALAWLGVQPPNALPDLVLLDLNMPRLNGLETLAALRADPRLQHLPVVMLTTSDAPVDIQRAYTLGATSYLTKPHTLPQMMDLARAILAFWTRAVPPARMSGVPV